MTLAVLRREKTLAERTQHFDVHRITGNRTRQSTGRRIGWEALHLAIDAPSRLADAETLPAEKRGSGLTFLANALHVFRRHGIAVARVMTDNGPACTPPRYAKAQGRLSIWHKRTRPYTPQGVSL